MPMGMGYPSRTRTPMIGARRGMSRLGMPGMLPGPTLAGGAPRVLGARPTGPAVNRIGTPALGMQGRLKKTPRVLTGRRR